MKTLTCQCIDLTTTQYQDLGFLTKNFLSGRKRFFALPASAGVRTSMQLRSGAEVSARSLLWPGNDSAVLCCAWGGS